jgi:hypothetical protein
MLNDAAIKIVEKGESIKIKLEVVAGNKAIPTGKVEISKGGKPQELTFKWSMFSSKTVPVRSIDWQEKSESNAGEAIVGAIAGAVLSGGIGAVAGAAIGGRKQNTSTARLTILDDDNREQELYLRCNGKEYELLQRLLLAEESQTLKMLKDRLSK